MNEKFKAVSDIFSGGIKIGNIEISGNSIYSFVHIFFQILFILVLMFLSVRIGNKIIDKFINRQKNLRFSLDEKKANTIGTVLKSILRYSVYFLGIFMIIEIIFGRIGSIFVGLGGAALGFGAQSLVKDVISGFLILFENQFSVGDYVTIEDKSGIVEEIELRITRIKDFNGDVHIIPNGLINKMTNHVKNPIRFKVEIGIAYEESVNNAINKINSICESFSEKNGDILVENPKVYGVTSLGDSSVNITIYGKCVPMNQWSAEVKLRQEILNGLNRENIEIPYNKINIVK
ncbi:mechanosensitive ion channel family protein [Clostridium oceanicum]|uniref:Mechanosensitive ion channel family protein n=1 Tax=Clostridium oceanicum TaxID=1543 RepID=A0ABP3UZS6_9CLOT